MKNTTIKKGMTGQQVVCNHEKRLDIHKANFQKMIIDMEKFKKENKKYKKELDELDEAIQSFANDVEKAWDSLQTENEELKKRIEKLEKSKI